MNFNIQDLRECACYNIKCPARTKDKPWPYMDISLDGKSIKCPHCGEKMSVLAKTGWNGEYE